MNPRYPPPPRRRRTTTTTTTTTTTAQQRFHNYPRHYRPSQHAIVRPPYIVRRPSMPTAYQHHHRQQHHQHHHQYHHHHQHRQPQRPVFYPHRVPYRPHSARPQMLPPPEGVGLMPRHHDYHHRHMRPRTGPPPPPHGFVSIPRNRFENVERYTGFVSNISDAIDTAAVREMLNTCGINQWFQYADVVRSDCDCGFFVFGDPEDALRSVRLLNGLVISGNAIEVKLPAETRVKLAMYEMSGRSEKSTSILKRRDDGTIEKVTVRDMKDAEAFRKIQEILGPLGGALEKTSTKENVDADDDISKNVRQFQARQRSLRIESFRKKEAYLVEQLDRLIDEDECRKRSVSAHDEFDATEKLPVAKSEEESRPSKIQKIDESGVDGGRQEMRPSNIQKIDESGVDGGCETPSNRLPRAAAAPSIIRTNGGSIDGTPGDDGKTSPFKAVVLDGASDTLTDVHINNLKDDELFRHPIDRQRVDAVIQRSALKIWIARDMEEHIGMAEDDVADFIVEKIKAQESPKTIVSELEPIFDDDAMPFVARLWRYLLLSVAKTGHSPHA